MLRSSVIRAAGSASGSLRQKMPAAVAPLNQARQAHAISNPTLANIEKRWEAMPPQEQAELWMALRDRMKVDWTELTLQEKKAGTWYIAVSGLFSCLSCSSAVSSVSRLSIGSIST
jgi:cytochrome c oxidase subunit 4